MLERKDYDGELGFLNHVLARGSEIYRTAPWLCSPFSADIWEIRFGDQVKIQSINFAVHMSDGFLLTDTRYIKLLNSLKEWLCACTHPHATASRMLNPSTMKARIHRTLHIIDYFLLRQDEYDLCSYGLEGLTENDFLVLISRLACTPSVAESVYEWTPRLRRFLLEGAQTVSAKELAETQQDMPTIDAGLDRDGDLRLTPAELLSARVWLWKQGLYRNVVRGTFKLSPNVMEIVSRIYSNTLWGCQARELPDELLLSEERLANRELPAVPVMDVDDECNSDRTISLYMRCLGHMRLLEHTGYHVPSVALASIVERDISSWLQVKEVGRFQTLPQEFVLYTLRQAITFVLTYGDSIVDAYCAIAAKAKSDKCRFSEVENKHDLQELLPGSLTALGVRRWRITVGSKVSGDYYFRLRSNEGLCELIMIFIGAAFVITGALTARRNGELTDLRVRDCLDKGGRHLVFDNRKSGVGDFRQREERPVPPLVVRIVRLLERLHSSDLGAQRASSGKALFSYPNRRSGALTDGSKNGVYCCVDLFCDYFQVAGDAPGTRYYIRQHQLRRFFAIAFFWGSGFGGLDTLRWFLGHTDPKHVWRYILESVPGKVLTSVRSRYATEALISGSAETDALADLVEKKFGTRQFSVLNELELEEYIEMLLEDSRLSVEPQFIEADSGHKYRIAILVVEKEVLDG